jgi:hypothetical protein
MPRLKIRVSWNCFMNKIESNWHWSMNSRCRNQRYIRNGLPKRLNNSKHSQWGSSKKHRFLARGEWGAHEIQCCFAFGGIPSVITGKISERVLVGRECELSSSLAYQFDAASGGSKLIFLISEKNCHVGTTLSQPWKNRL